MKPALVLAVLLGSASSLVAQLPPAQPLEITSENAPVWASDLYSWFGEWQAPQALFDRGEHQDDPEAWSQDGNDEGSTWSNPLPGESCGILVVDLGAVVSIDHFAVFQMMGSDGRTTAVSLFRNSAFTGDVAPGSSGDGWKAVVTQHAVAEGVLDAGTVTSPTAIDVAPFQTRYLMIHAFNDGTLGAGEYIELKGIKAFFEDSMNLLRAGPTLVVAIDPPAAGTTDPAPGRYELTPDEPVEIELLAEEDAEFDGWELAGPGEVQDDQATSTTVTVGVNGGKVTARLSLDRITRGSTRTATAEEAGLLEPFTSKPSVSATFTDPFSGKTLEAHARVLTKVSKASPADSIVFEWRRRVRLYDPQALKAMEAIGQGAAAYVSAWQKQMALHLTIAGKDVPLDQSLAMRGLGAPEIEGAEEVEVGGQPALRLFGTSFGTGKPKVWREYLVNVAPGLDEIRRQPMKVVKPTAADAVHFDAKGKPACMSPTTGESEVRVLVPAEPAEGTLTGVLVIDSGVGLGTLELED